MNEIKNIIKKILGQDIYLLDLKEDIYTNTFKLIVDSKNPITLNLTTEIAQALDRSEAMNEKYPEGFRIEVSSPGIGAALTEPFQFQKNIGRELKIITDEQGAFSKKAKVRLIDVKDEEIIVKTTASDVVGVKYDHILIAKTIVSFS